MKRVFYVVFLVFILFGASLVGAQESNSTLTEPKSTIGKADRNATPPVIAQPDMTSSLIQVTLGLLVVLLIIAAAAWFTRRFGQFQKTAGGNLQIIGGLHLSAREKLIIVQVGEEQLLLGVAPGRVSTLHVLPEPLTQQNSHKTPGASFVERLNAVMKGRQRES